MNFLACSARLAMVVFDQQPRGNVFSFEICCTEYF